MEMTMSICRKESEDEQTPMKRKRKKIDRFMFLPDDILLDILKRLPDDFPRYMAKYVCRRWFNIITNRILLDHASFILQRTGNLTARHVGIREEEHEGIRVKVQDLDIPPIGIIRSWANEFLLISDYKNQSLYVYNLITKEGSYLPQRNASCGGYCTIKCGVALSFNVFKGIYKVVHLFMGPPIECHILILRRDIVSSKWKKIHVPCINGGGSLYSSNLVSVQGRYFHWDKCIHKRLLSIDMVKEEIVYTSLPSDHRTGVSYTIFEMGGSLAFFAGDSTPDKAEIWILKDFQRKKWEKLQSSVTLDKWYYRSSVTLEKWYYRRFPVCGMMSNRSRYIILEYCKDDKGMCYYDLKIGVMKKLDIHINVDDGCVVLSSPSFKLSKSVKQEGGGGINAL